MRKSCRSIRFLALLTALCLLAVAGCSQQERQPAAAEEQRYAGYRFGEENSVDFGVQPLSLPEASVSELICRDRVLSSRLRASGHFLQPFPFFKGKDLHRFITSGKLEAGILGDMPAIAAAAKGDIVIVAMIKQGFSSIVAGRPMLVKDLRGKRVATGLGSTAHFSLLNALEGEGLSERDITLVGMEVSEMAQALAAGKIDAFSAWEPTPALAFAAHPGFHLVHKALSFGFLCLRRDFVAGHPEQTREIAAAVARSCLWMRQPGTLERVAGWTAASAAAFQGQPYPLPAAQMMELTRRDLLHVPAAPMIPERLLKEQEMLGKEFNFLKKNGNIPAETPWETIRASFDTGLLREVMSEPARYRIEEFDYQEQKGGAQ